jgi:hypothetical protein
MDREDFWRAYDEAIRDLIYSIMPESDGDAEAADADVVVLDDLRTLVKEQIRVERREAVARDRKRR